MSNVVTKSGKKKTNKYILYRLCSASPEREQVVHVCDVTWERPSLFSLGGEGQVNMKLKTIWGYVFEEEIT